MRLEYLLSGEAEGFAEKKTRSGAFRRYLVVSILIGWRWGDPALSAEAVQGPQRALTYWEETYKSEAREERASKETNVEQS